MKSDIGVDKSAALRRKGSRVYEQGEVGADSWHGGLRVRADGGAEKMRVIKPDIVADLLTQAGNEI